MIEEKLCEQVDFCLKMKNQALAWRARWRTAHAVVSGVTKDQVSFSVPLYKSVERRDHAVPSTMGFYKRRIKT